MLLQQLGDDFVLLHEFGFELGNLAIFVDTLNNTLGDLINETFALSSALLAALE
ncbi:MAG: hypothetical protein ACKV2Q_30810 [Planctomycetaceae bacterium]